MFEKRSHGSAHGSENFPGTRDYRGDEAVKHECEEAKDKKARCVHDFIARFVRVYDVDDEC